MNIARQVQFNLCIHITLWCVDNKYRCLPYTRLRWVPNLNLLLRWPPGMFIMQSTSSCLVQSARLFTHVKHIEWYVQMKRVMSGLYPMSQTIVKLKSYNSEQTFKQILKHSCFPLVNAVCMRMHSIANPFKETKTNT